MARQCVGRCSGRRGATTLAPMKTLLRLALAGALTAVLVRWLRDRSESADATLPNRESAGQPTGDWEPDAAEPLRGENLRVEPGGIH